MKNFSILFIIAAFMLVSFTQSVLGKNVSVSVEAIGCFQECIMRNSCGSHHSCCKSSVKIDGVEHLDGKNGIHFIIMDPFRGNVIRQVHASHLREVIRKVKPFLRKTKKGSIVIILKQRACKGRFRGWYRLVRRYLAGPADQFQPQGLDTFIAVFCVGKCLPEVQNKIPMPKLKRGSTNSVKLSFKWPIRNVHEDSGQKATSSIPYSTNNCTRKPTMKTISTLRMLKATSRTKSNESKTPADFAVGIGVSVGVVVLALLGILAIVVMRKKKNQNPVIDYYYTTPAVGFKDNQPYCTITKRDDPPEYQKLKLQNDTDTLYDYVPQSAPSTSPSSNFHKLPNNNSCHPDKCEQYVNMTKDRPDYKIPSNVVKRDPPKSSPPPPDSDYEAYVDFEDHVYEDPKRSVCPYPVASGLHQGEDI